MKYILILIAILIVLIIYFVYNEGNFHINNERVGFMLVRDGYRAYWIRYSHGLKYPYRPYRDNLWCFPRLEYWTPRKLKD